VRDIKFWVIFATLNSFSIKFFSQEFYNQNCVHTWINSTCHTSLSIKEGSSFCLSHWNLSNPSLPNYAFGIIGKLSSMSVGATKVVLNPSILKICQK